MKFRDTCLSLAIFLVFDQTIPNGLAQEAARPPEQVEPTRHNVIAANAAKLKAEHEIAEFFKAYKETTGDTSGARQSEFYDVNRLVAELVTQAGVDLSEDEQQAMVRAFEGPFQKQMVMIQGDWYRHQISRIDFLDEFVDAEVFVRHWDADDITARQLLWLHRTDDGWKIYDVADLSIGVSYTSMGAIGLRQAAAGNLSEEDVFAIRTLTQLAQVMNDADLVTASELINQLKGRPVPDFMEWFRCFMEGVVSMQYGGGVALEAFDKVEAYRPNVPMLDYMRAVAYNLMSRHDRAEFHARRYLQRFGDDADALVEVARAQIGRQQSDAAIQTLRLALDDTPASLTAIELLAICLPDERKAEFLADFRLVRLPSESFQYLADSFEILKEEKPLRLLVEEMVKTHPEETLLDYYQAVVLALEGKHSESMDALREAIKNVSEEDDNRYHYDTLLHSEAMLSGRLCELYEAADDKSESFESLVQHAIDADEYEAAREVVRAHLSANPSDAAALTLAGDVEFFAEDYASADVRYAEARRRRSRARETTRSAAAVSIRHVG